MANFGDNLLKGIGGLASLAGVTLPFLGIKAQANENMRLAQFQAQQNQRYLDQQLEYNSPKAQMARFKEAGLNPNLIYGQGTSGNQSAPLTYPEVRPVISRNFYRSLLPLISLCLLNHKYKRSRLGLLRTLLLRNLPGLKKNWLIETRI